MKQNGIALVTGAGQGVGRGIARMLAAQGTAVAINDLYESRANKVAEEIRSEGGQALACPADVRDFAQISTMYAAIEARYGPVSILINNAGVPPRSREPGAERPFFADGTPEDHNDVVALNLTGTMSCTLLALRAMRRARFGRIVNIVSEAARAGEAGLAAYSGAKAGIIGLSRALAREYGRDCITVNCVALGATSHEGILTGPLSHGNSPEKDEKLARMLRAYPAGQGLQRVGTPEDVAAAVKYLTSAEAAFVTGQCLGVSGGFFMG